MDFLFQVIAIAIPVIYAITVHEVAHGLIAKGFGDFTASRQGRLTLNPIAHIDLLGTVIGAINGFKAQEIIPKTETFHIQNILNNGTFTSIPNVSTRINNFWITYTLSLIHISEPTRPY